MFYLITWSSLEESQNINALPQRVSPRVSQRHLKLASARARFEYFRKSEIRKGFLVSVGRWVDGLGYSHGSFGIPAHTERDDWVVLP